MNNYDRMHRGEEIKIPENKARVAVVGKRKKIVKIVFAVVLLLSIILLIGLFDVYGAAYSNAIYGSFGCASIAGIIVVIALSILKLVGAKPKKLSARTICYMVVLFLLIVLFMQIISTVNDYRALPEKSYRAYLDTCFFNGRNNAGGALFGLFSYPFLRYIGSVTSLCLIAVAFFGVLLMCFRSFFYVEKVQTVVSEESDNSGMYIETIEDDKKSKKKKDNEIDLSFPNDLYPDEEPEEEIEDAEIHYTAGTLSDKIVSGVFDEKLDKKQRQKMAEEILFMSEEEMNKKILRHQTETEIGDSAIQTGERKPFQTGFGGEPEKKTKKISVQDAYKNYEKGGISAKELLFGKSIESYDYTYEELYPNANKGYNDLDGLLYTGKDPVKSYRTEPETESPTRPSDDNKNVSVSPETPKSVYADERPVDVEPEKPFENVKSTSFDSSTPIASLTDVSTAIYDESIDLAEPKPTETHTPYVERPMIKPDEKLEERASVFGTVYRPDDNNDDNNDDTSDESYDATDDADVIISSRTKQPPKPEVKKEIRPYTCPSLALLEEPPVAESNIDYVSVYKRIEDSFKSYDMNVRVIAHTRGPTFTLYAVQLGEGVYFKRVMSREEDINRKMHCDEPIHILPSVKNMDAIGIEVYYKNLTMKVPLKRYLSSSKYKEPDKLYFPVGVDVYGDAFYCNLLGAPHLLIGGTTGSGKSVCINVILCTILYNYSPDFVKFILVDPKAVELVAFETVPHNLLGKSITNPDECLKALSWAVKEMNHRYELMAQSQTKQLASYNAYLKSINEKPLPYIVIVIDELADMMKSNKKTAQELDTKINILTAKARAAGIHLILATQRPSADVITGLIKNNVSTRIAFTMGDMVASKVILDKGGAEKLYGKGDLLFSSTEYLNPLRLQGMFLSDDETRYVCKYVIDNNDFVLDQKIYDEIFGTKPLALDGPANAVQPPKMSASEQRDMELKRFFIEVVTMVAKLKEISISSIQRTYRIGFNKAGFIVDKMYAMGLIEPDQQGSSKKRAVLYTEADLPEIIRKVEQDDSF